MTAASVRVVRGGDRAAALAALLGPAASNTRLWMDQNTQVLKRDANSQVALAQLDGKPYYLKYYRAKFIGQTLLFGLGLGRGVRSFTAAQQLRSQQIAVPEGIACLTVSGGLLLVTEGFSGALNLKSQWLADGVDEQQKGVLLNQAAAAVAALHLAGHSHGDMKWANLLLVDRSFVLVDLEAVSGAARGSRAMWRDVARFILNCEDMAVKPDVFDGFVSAYLECTGYSREHLGRQVMPLMVNLRKRHVAKYGERGHHLLD